MDLKVGARGTSARRSDGLALTGLAPTPRHVNAPLAPPYLRGGGLSARPFNAEPLT
jgi:hypothetical protein